MTLLHSANHIDTNLNFKAPRGFLYFIESINFANSQSDDLIIMVVDRELDPVGVNDVSSTSSVIASYASFIQGSNHQITGINHRTKYIGVTKTLGVSVNTQIQFYGELIKASRLELIMEFFRKGRA